MAKKKPPVPARKLLVPRAGPPTNIRPGGPHADDAGKKRDADIRKALRNLDLDADAL